MQLLAHQSTVVSYILITESKRCVNESVKSQECMWFELIGFVTMNLSMCVSLHLRDLVLEPSQTLNEFTQKWRTSWPAVNVIPSSR